MTMELTQSVGSSTFLMTPLFSMSINAFFTLLRNVAGIFLRGFMTGVTELSILILYGLSSHPNPENTFGCSLISLSNSHVLLLFTAKTTLMSPRSCDALNPNNDICLELVT